MDKRKSCCQDDAVAYYKCNRCDGHAFHLKKVPQLGDPIEAEICCENPDGGEVIKCYRCGEYIILGRNSLDRIQELEKIKS